MFNPPTPRHDNNTLQAVNYNVNCKTVGVTAKAIRLVTGICIGGFLLAGCGQKNDLYLPKDAPSNTDFILYEGNQADDDAAQNADNSNTPEQSVPDVDPNSITTDPNDY